MKSVMANLAAHLLACLLFVALLWIGFSVRERLMGALPPSGIAGALTLALLLYGVAGANLLIALVPYDAVKAVLCVLLAVAVLVCFLPEHPLRAVYFSTAAAAASWLGVLAGRRLARYRR